MAKCILFVSGSFILMSLLNISAVAAHGNNAAWEECKTAEKVTDDDLKNMKDPSQSKTRPMKCMLACLGEKSGKIVNNKLNADGVTNWFKNSPTYNEQVQQSVNEFLQEYNKVAEEPDRCDFGAKLMTCIKDGAIKRGIRPGFQKKA